LSAQKQIDTDTNTKPVGYAQIAAAVAATHADAVLVGAAPDPARRRSGRSSTAPLPNVKLFAPSTLATAPFLATLGAAASATYVTSPILPLKQYPRQAQSVLAAYRKEFGLAPTAYSLYGYEAMQSVLAAIQRARQVDGRPLSPRCRRRLLPSRRAQQRDRALFDQQRRR
jgi:ABC-type branched-subunit amino acid transport system substrate-binding protein